ncbi:MAG: hypothetical protein JNL98_29730 [Bryobacterales bacterium]|nr:hypothetical protein [Bryobacterales bacterium]
MSNLRKASLAMVIVGLVGMLALVFIMALQTKQAEQKATGGGGYAYGTNVVTIGLVPVSICWTVVGLALYSKSKNSKTGK